PGAAPNTPSARARARRRRRCWSRFTPEAPKRRLRRRGAMAEHVCDKCGAAMMRREGPRGPFLACSAYPKCRNAKDVDAEGNPVKPIDTGIQCEKCGAPMAVKRGPRGPFLGCSAYPKCRSTKPVPDDLKEKLQKLMPAPAKQA